ncbi:terminase small subunit [Achromobacter xylosoxidans]|uniref:terminase small subunit n=1 Tax=Alcaligenes xylosoxydans xylosoxydans TaxID=85698 RepID=UPI0006C3A575|nr:terminase small subunit [Achromobacter xylosoxidans]CUK22968.1 Terminase small subunit [Achromobacter xylosoxidans]
MALTDKQRRFVDEYLVDLNATQAAIRAGYSQKTAGQIGEQNLKKLEIAAAVQEAQAARAKRTEITQDMVLRELAKIGFSDIRKIVRWGKTELRVADAGDDEEEVTEAYHGLALVSADDIDDDTAAAISEISEGREGLKVKLHDKKGALVDIGRHLGMFRDRIEHSGPNGGPIPIAEMTDEQLAAIAAGGRA